MTREEVITKLTPIVREVFGNDGLVIDNTMSAETMPEWTSLSFMKLLSEIQKQFDFKFNMIEILHLQSMGAVIDAVQKHTV